LDIQSELIFAAWCTYPRNETLVHQKTLPSPATPPSPLTATHEAICIAWARYRASS